MGKKLSEDLKCYECGSSEIWLEDYETNPSAELEVGDSSEENIIEKHAHCDDCGAVWVV